MASYFLDSSAVVKLYHPEVGSATIQKIFAEPESRILVSRLAVVEVRSAFAGKLRMRAIAADKKLGEVAAVEGLPVLNPDPSLPA